MPSAAFFVLLAFLGAVSLCGAAIWFGVTVAKDRRDRLRILEDAIRDGKLDDATREALLQGLVRDREDRHRGGRRRGGFGRLVFALGWMAMVSGVGLFTIGEPDSTEAGVFFVVLGFGMVTLPMALREYDRRGDVVRSD